MLHPPLARWSAPPSASDAAHAVAAYTNHPRRSRSNKSDTNIPIGTAAAGCLAKAAATASPAAQAKPRRVSIERRPATKAAVMSAIATESTRAHGKYSWKIPRKAIQAEAAQIPAVGPRRRHASQPNKNAVARTPTKERARGQRKPPPPIFHAAARSTEPTGGYMNVSAASLTGFV